MSGDDNGQIPAEPFPKDRQIARNILADAYDTPEVTVTLYGLKVQRSDFERNLWDVYRVEDGKAHHVDTVNANAIGTANVLLDLLQNYPNSDPESQPEEPEHVSRMVH